METMILFLWSEKSHFNTIYNLNNFLSCFFAIASFPGLISLIYTPATTKAALLINSTSAENDWYLVRMDIFLATLRKKIGGMYSSILVEMWLGEI